MNATTLEHDDRAHVAAPTKHAPGGWEVERWPNHLGWNVGPHTVIWQTDGSVHVWLEGAEASYRHPVSHPVAAVEAALDAHEASRPAAPEPESEPAPEPPKVRPDAPKARHRLLLPPNLAGLANLTAKEGHRFALSGVRLMSTERGYRAEATNGKILGVVTGEEAGDPAEYPALSLLKDAPNGATSAIVHAAAWKEAFKLVPKKVGPKLACLAAVLGKDATTFAATDLERSRGSQTRNMNGQFPDVDNAIPRGTPAAAVRLDAFLLIDLLKAAVEFTEDGHPGVVTIELRAGTTPVVVRASDGGQEFTGLLVPLSDLTPKPAKEEHDE